MGDDLITAGMIERMRRHNPAAQVDLVTDAAVLPPDLPPATWVGTLPEVLSRFADETAPNALELESYDGAILAGGGNLNSIWPSVIADRRQLVDELHRAGVPVVVSGQGIGPFTNERDREAVQGMLAKAARVGVRDELSLDELRPVVSGVAADIVGDDALGLAPPPRREVDQLLRTVGIPDHAPFLVLNVRSVDYVGLDEATLSSIADDLDAIAAERGCRILGVAVYWVPPNPEPETLERLARTSARRVMWNLLDEPERPRLVAGALRRADRALVCSYHAALVSLEARVPTLYFAGSSYSRQKAEGLRRLAGLPDEFVIDPDAPGPDLRERFGLVELALRVGAGLAEPAERVEAWHDERLHEMFLT